MEDRRGKTSFIIYTAHGITLFSQFDFAFEQVSKFIVDMFVTNMVGFTPMFVITSSLAN